MDAKLKNEETVDLTVQMLSGEPESVSPTWIDVLPQIISSCAAHTLVMQVGIHMTYSTVQIPHLDLTTEQSSWLAGLVTITNPLGALCIGPIMDRVGRKWSLLLVCVPFSISPILTLISGPADVSLLYVSKIAAGVGAGMSTVAMVYVSEITHKEYRPALLCLNSVFVSAGILLTALLNLYLDWTHLSICFLSMVLVSGALLVFLAPESPHWSIKLDAACGVERRIMNAQRSLKYFNPNKKVFETEWRLLNQTRIKHDVTNDEGPLLRRILKSRQCYKPLIILLILFSLQQLTGVYSVIFYAMQLFKQVGTGFSSGNDEAPALVYLAAIRFVMSIATTVLARGFGRKPLLIVSAAGMCVFSLLLSANLFIKSTNDVGHHLDAVNATHLLPVNNLVTSNMSSPLFQVNEGMMRGEEEGVRYMSHSVTRIHHSTNHSTHINSSRSVNLPRTLTTDHLSLLCILLYVCFSAVGVIVIPWTMIAELLPDFARGTCSGFLISYGYIWMFVVVKFFLSALEHSVMATFLLFGTVSAVLVVFVYFHVPETKGKSFVEIQKYFS